jgi:hypothetical protein
MASENILKQCAFLVISAFSSYMFGSVTSSPDWLFLPLLRPSPNPRPSSLLKPLDGFGEISSINITLSLLSLSPSLSWHLQMYYAFLVLQLPITILCLAVQSTRSWTRVTSTCKLYIESNSTSHVFDFQLDSRETIYPQTACKSTRKSLNSFHCFI